MDGKEWGAWLAGFWAVSRRIRHRGGAVWTIRGVVEIRRAGEGWAWRETAVLAESQAETDGAGQNAAVFAAERRYRLIAAGTGLFVQFEDGRPFYRLAPGGQDRHLCGADLYRVRTQHGSGNCWRQGWQVTGPAKAYRIAASYRRAAGTLQQSGGHARERQA